MKNKENTKIRILVIHNSGMANSNYRKAFLERYPFLGAIKNYSTHIKTLEDSITEVYDKVYIDLDSVKQEEYWSNKKSIKIQVNNSKPHTQYQWFSLTGKKKLTTKVPFMIKKGDK